MPLHDLSYQRFDGVRTHRFERSLALARSSAVLLLKRRAFLLLLGVCWIPAIVRAAQIYIARQFPQAAQWVTVDPSLWQEFLSQQIELLPILPVLLVALYTGAGAISNDLAAGAFVVYLSKPISRIDYVAGKAMPVVGAILVVTLVPSLMLLGVHLAVAEDLTLLEAAPLLPLSAITYSLWVGFFFALVVLSISSLSRSGRVAGAGFVALALGGKIIVTGALPRLGLDSPLFLSMTDAAVDSSHVFFGNVTSGDAPYLSIVWMFSLMVLSGFILRWRLRSIEVSS